jgi:hypothetical protein
MQRSQLTEENEKESTCRMKMLKKNVEERGKWDEEGRHS